MDLETGRSLDDKSSKLLGNLALILTELRPVTNTNIVIGNRLREPNSVSITIIL